MATYVIGDVHGQLKQLKLLISKMNDTSAVIDWVKDMTTGIEKIDEAIAKGQPYDLDITDMHYPLSPGVKADWEAGDFFVDLITGKYPNLPVIICSTYNMKNPKAYGCVWFDDLNDWENELLYLVSELKKEGL